METRPLAAGSPGGAPPAGAAGLRVRGGRGVPWEACVERGSEDDSRVLGVEGLGRERPRAWRQRRLRGRKRDSALRKPSRKGIPVSGAEAMLSPRPSGSSVPDFQTSVPIAGVLCGAYWSTGFVSFGEWGELHSLHLYTSRPSPSRPRKWPGNGSCAFDAASLVLKCPF